VIDFIKTKFIKYKSIISYGFFGVLTTIVNIITYRFFSNNLSFATVPSTVIAWIFAVVFAYLTNRKWVFKSYATTPKELFSEFVSFITCRLGTGILDVAGMKFFVDILNFNGTITKTALNVLVIILNYVASKLIIFRKK
jgi:putative flippase GtrA